MIKKNKKIIKNLLLLLSSTFLSYLIIKWVLLNINEPEADLNILYFFAFPFFYYIILFLIEKNKIMKKILKKYIYVILFSILSLIINYFLFKNNTLLSIINISIFISIWSHYYSSSKTTSKIINTINFFLYFLISYLSILCLLLISINFTIDEGFILLIALLFFVYYLIFWNFLAFVNNKNEHMLKDNKKYILLNILLLILVIFSILFSYWSTIRNLSSPNLNQDISVNEVFDCTYANQKSVEVDSIINKNDIIKYLEKDSNKKIDKIATLYLLSNDLKWGQKFKEKLINEMNDNKFLDAGGSIKFWQYRVAIRGHYFIKINQKNPELFADHEKKQITQWFKKINDHAYKVTFADLAYSFLFMKKPTGLYLNQEIGAGFLAVMSEILKESYPKEAKKNLDFLKKEAIGWSGNFRNTDDGIVYHQSTWIKNAYLLAQYGNIGNPKSNLSRMSFDWIAHQIPLNGKIPKYNTLSQYSAADVMTMGAFLFKDGYYKYLAEKMLYQDIKSNNKIEEIIGLELWDDDLKPIKNQKDAICVIKGTTGLNFDPKKIKYDKLEFRKTINNKELFILVNLRSHGWHKYNSTGSVIMISYGDDILIKDNIKNITHNWLPKGKAGHRDKKINIEEITNYKKYTKGLANIFHNLTGIENLKYTTYQPFIENIKVNENGFEIVFYSLENKEIKLIGNIDINNNLYVYYTSEKNIQEVIKTELK